MQRLRSGCKTWWSGAGIQVHVQVGGPVHGRSGSVSYATDGGDQFLSNDVDVYINLRTA